jgi:PAS domain S-box-containing protein
MNHKELDLSTIAERIMLVDDDEGVLALLNSQAAILGLQADQAQNGKDAVELLQNRQYGLVITDIVMPEMDGMELLFHIREHYPQVDVLVISGHNKIYNSTDLIAAGATDFISKPFNLNELKAKLQRIFRERLLLAELVRSKEEWERTFNAINDIVTLQDLDLHIVKINQAGCNLLDMTYENIIVHHCYELFHGSSEPCPKCPLLHTKETFQPYAEEITHEKLGKTFLVSAAPVMDDQGKMTHIAHVAKDITEKKKIEEQLFLNEKIATIAGLAAGVAHEINTPLSGILQAQQMIEMRLAPDKPFNQKRAAECGVDLTKVHTYFKNNELDFFMKGMRDSAINAGNIIKNLLEFSRPHKGEIRNTTLTNLLDNTMELACADYDLKKKYDIINIEIVKEYNSGLTEVPCVAMEIQQVILNLVKNAVHAMADNNTENPRITLRLVKTEKMARIEV